MKKILLIIIGVLLVYSNALADVKIEKLKYPALATTTQDKMTFCYIAQEKLRIEHNVKGEDFKDGKITEKQWKAYLKDDFNVKFEVIINDLLVQKELMKKSTKYEVNLNDLEKD